MVRQASLAGLALCLALAGSCSADLLIKDYDPARNDRFYGGANPAFVGQGQDFDGVGYTGGAWANLISPHFALSANHSHPGIGSTVTFHLGNGPGTDTVTAVVSGFQDVAGSDLELVVFDTAVDAKVAPFSIVANDESALLTQQILVYGLPNRVGTNNIDGFQLVTDIGGAHDTYAMLYDYNTKNGNPNEAYLEGGDSGGPSFVMAAGGGLALAGIHSFNGTLDDGTLISGDNFVSHYIPDIQSAMNSYGFGDQLTIVQAVPEPASLSLIGLGLLALGARKGLRKADASPRS